MIRLLVGGAKIKTVRSHLSITDLAAGGGQAGPTCLRVAASGWVRSSSSQPATGQIIRGSVCWSGAASDWRLVLAGRFPWRTGKACRAWSSDQHGSNGTATQEHHGRCLLLRTCLARRRADRRRRNEPSERLARIRAGKGHDVDGHHPQRRARARRRDCAGIRLPCSTTQRARSMARCAVAWPDTAAVLLGSGWAMR